MYSLPKGFDADIMVGCVVETVVFAEYSIYIHLSKKIIITMLHEFELNKKLYQIPLKESDLMKILGHKIINASGSDVGDLVLIFDDNGSLSVINSQDNYESYSISIGKKEIYV